MAASGSHPSRVVQPSGAAPSATGRHTLRRAQRIRDAGVFREAFEQSKAFPGKFMVLRVRRGEGAAMRLGVVTGKRTLRRAVDRVHARRLLREAFRLNRDGFRKDCDVVLVARALIRTATRQEVEGDLLGLARRAGLRAPRRQAPPAGLPPPTDLGGAHE